ncbi:ABC-type transport system involved in cytochrome bd biosynthesis, fused ATPase and permease components [Variovorax sp. PBL-H6]|uniref:AAA family ATPase n=1 Tax=Variovorax sp. PBL-H6 TaxID=434009 RepID=UPI001318CA2F|nr:AAA family ATPase [Variovorax sp. PBL-H6]VTU15149.1 ABC-type transport system involved in cytochrome bd biosynthesis, fused ATPase and permease components [Variovorax sp. PBL-H6]
MAEWKIYNPDAKPAKSKVKLPPPPPWRQPGPGRRAVIASTFRATDKVRDAVNVALHLRRPLLITGKPGTGKSSLVYSVAQQLGLGDVLVWPINSRSALQEGLYRYDALARLQQIQQQQARSAAKPAAGLPAQKTAMNAVDGAAADGFDELGAFVTLGPLGSALAAADAPRALLIDEIDKSDVDLPNDLLGVLDTGSFSIAELQRVADRQPDVAVRSIEGSPVTVHKGVVSFSEFPFIVMTSNGERDFPAPFLRRCVQCTLADPDEAQLASIVRAHLPAMAIDPQMQGLLNEFLSRREQGALATDQLLNAQYLSPHRQGLSKEEQERILDVLFKSLD